MINFEFSIGLGQRRGYLWPELKRQIYCGSDPMVKGLNYFHRKQKRRSANTAAFFYLVGRAGLEPATNGLKDVLVG